jgi:sigma-B regulation protein RsbU (phosphoserine phosphatase)
MVGSHIDITKRKETEQALLERNAQLCVAQHIQEYLLPDKSPALPGFDIAGASHPAEYAAGDHYDFLDMSDGSTGFVVGDVSGHGIGPAILMASLCARLRSLAETDRPIDGILTRANIALTNEVEESQFITAILARLDTTSKTLTYVNAGHPSGYVLDRCGRVKALMESTGIPLAILPEAEFTFGTSIKLERGDTVILLTDGVLEARSPDGEFFGMDRVLQVVRRNYDQVAGELIGLVRHAVSEFCGGKELSDDFTMVLMKFGCSAMADSHGEDPKVLCNED